MSEVTIEYMAGFFDADGCVSIRTEKNSLHDKLIVGNNNKFILECIKKTFGGNICMPKIYTADGFNRKQHYKWTLCGRYGVALAKLLYPLCWEKKEKLEKFIERNENNAEGL